MAGNWVAIGHELIVPFQSNLVLRTGEVAAESRVVMFLTVTAMIMVII
jgi:hypothetical protein